ncbi:hypothetical protein GE061_001755, partial [Apolygus lucorum]
YGQKSVGGPEHVPPGWDSWVGLVGNSRYYNYSLSINGTAKKYTTEYLTNVLSAFAEEFLDYQRPENSPFLMVLAPPAPHAPFTPEPKYVGKFKDKRVPREPHFNTANNSDKHWLVRMKPVPLPNETVELLDDYYAMRWETLLSKSMSTNPILLIDIHATILQMAGVQPMSTDGRSILPIEPTGNRTFYLEYRGEGSEKYDPSCPWRDNHLSLCSSKACCKCQDSTNNTYSCVRSVIDEVEDFVFCRFEDDEAFVEAYDMIKDPYQLVNLYPGLDPAKKKHFSVLLDSWMPVED